MSPKVSILVPVYNVEAFIERCAVSLFEQTFDDIEYIFVNDCTPDNSIEVLKKVIEKYPNRNSHIKIIHHKTNRGLAGARNTGIQNATGDYILHIDSDDYIDLATVSLLYNSALTNDSDMVICDYILEWKNQKKHIVQSWDESNTEFIKQILAVDAMPCVWNKLIRRSIYISNDISAIEGVNLGEDLSVLPKLLYFAKKINKVDKNLIHYMQINPNSYTKNYNIKNIQNVISVMSELTFFFESKKDYYLYADSILKGKIRKKIDLIYNSDKQYWDDLINIFPEINELRGYSFLSYREKISYFFIRNNFKKSFYLYRANYLKIFKVVQRIKGR